jgi:hypothetical protein
METGNVGYWVLAAGRHVVCCIVANVAGSWALTGHCGLRIVATYVPDYTVLK